MAGNSRNVVAGAAIGACLGAVVGWMISRRGNGGKDSALVEFDRSRALGVLWAVVGVVRLIMEMDAE